MARIPQDEVEHLKREVKVADVARGRGVELTAVGPELRGHCPFHDDTTPSFFVNDADNVWNCRGACDAGGSVVDYVMRAEGIGFRHAVEWLRAYAGGEVTPTRTAVVKVASTRKLANPFEAGSDGQALLNRYAAYCHQVFKRTPAAQAYVEKRGLMKAGLAEKFQVGFADRSLGLRLPNKQRVEGRRTRELLQQVGVLRDSGHEHLGGCITFPIVDEAGNVQQIYGRRIGSVTADQPRHFYLPGGQRGVWNEGALGASGGIMILCEAIIDALTLWCAGFHNVTSAFGANGFHDDMLESLRRHGVEDVLIAYDRDEAGTAGAQRVAERLAAAGMGAYRVKLPMGMDVNEYARQVRPVERSLRLVLRSADHMAGPAVDLTSRIELPLVGEEARELLPAPAVAIPVEEQPAVATAVNGNDAAVVDGDEVRMMLGDRQWRLRGWLRNNVSDVLRVNVMVTVGERFHVDNFDLYSARGRNFFLAMATDELRLGEEVLKADIGKVLRQMERLQQKRLKEADKPQKKQVPELTPEERADAMALLTDDRLCDRVVEDLDKCGLVGERVNKLTAYLGCVSRKLARPLGIMVQSGSGSGKTTLMDAVLSLMPEEEREKYSAMTERALYYVGEDELSHKILGVVEEEGAERASYALKLLQSEGELTVASTAKDPQTGQLSTRSYRVRGPVMIFVTTTKTQQDEELVNRCLLLTADESREQTRAIHEAQRNKRTVEGLFASLGRQKVRTLHQNAQRLLKPLCVMNPYVRDLRFMDEKTRTRRDFEKYLTLIDAVALLRQYQKEMRHEEREGVRVEFIEVDEEDLQIANALALEVLGRTLDALPAQTRKFLTLLESMVTTLCAERGCRQEDIMFTRREMLDWTGWSYDQVRVHLGRLMEQEYVLVHRGTRGYQFVYELVYGGEGKDGGRFVLGSMGTTKGVGGISPGSGVGLGPRWGAFGGRVVGDADGGNAAVEREETVSGGADAPKKTVRRRGEETHRSVNGVAHRLP